MVANSFIDIYLDFLNDMGKCSDATPYLLDLQNKRLWFCKTTKMAFDFEKKDPSVDYYCLDEWLSVIHPNDRDVLYEAISAVASGEKDTHDIEYRVRSKTGTYIRVHSRGIVKTDKSEGSGILIGQLSECTLRHEDILKSANMGLWIIRNIGNGESFEMYADDTMKHIMGIEEELTPEECYNYWYSRIRKDCVNYVNSRVAQAVETGRMVQLQYFWNHPVKGEIELRCAGILTEDVDGEICLQGYHFNVNSVDMMTFLEQYQLSEQMIGLTSNENSQISGIIQAIQAFFYNLDELVYMTDMDTDDLIYLNRIGLEKYGFKSIDDLRGKKCYDILQKNHTPCSFCTNGELVPWEYTEWKIYNPIIKRHFMLKDTMITDGQKRYRIEIALDISDSENKIAVVEKYQGLEKVASEGIRHALEASTPDECINAFLEYLGKALNGDRAYIFEKNEHGNDDNTYEWVASGVEPQIDNLQNLPPEVCDIWYSRFHAGDYISFEDLEYIREDDPEMYDVLAPQGIHSIVVVPIFVDGEVVGFYGIDNPPVDALEYTYNLLNIVGHFLTSAIKRRYLFRQLHKLSHSDYLTNLENRLAMNEYIENIDSNKSLGVLYCDITGLKATNDNKGHEAGDKLIIDACSCLKTVFNGERLFRIGGDELLVMCSGITKTMLQEKTEIVREMLEEKSIVLAIGMDFCSDMSERTVDGLIKTAEKLMYEEKSLYYKKKGLDRRKS